MERTRYPCPGLWLTSPPLFLIAQFDVIDKDILKASGLGKIVNFYTRTKRVQPDITRQANLLIDKWSKPILRAAGVSVGGRGGINASGGGGGGDDEQDYASGGANSRDRGVVTMSAKEAKRRDEMRQGTVPVGEETVKTRRPHTIVSVIIRRESRELWFRHLTLVFSFLSLMWLSGTFVYDSATLSTYCSKHRRARTRGCSTETARIASWIP